MGFKYFSFLVKLFRVVYSIIYFILTSQRFRKYTILLQLKTRSNSSTTNNRQGPLTFALITSRTKYYILTPDLLDFFIASELKSKFLIFFTYP